MMYPLITAMVLAGVPASVETPEEYRIFNGKDLTGWKVSGGKNEAWGVEDGLLYTTGQAGGWLLTEKEYDDFEFLLEYKVPKGGNSGAALRTPPTGDPAYVGMEIQILDDPSYKGLRPSQHTGSIYDVVASENLKTNPPGEWNQMHIIAKGRQVTVKVNGITVVDANLDDHKERGDRHPGLLRAKGHVGVQSHGSRVEFRNLFVKPLK